MVISSSALGCGMTVCIAFWAADLSAEDGPKSKQQTFGGWTVTITPAGAVPAIAGQVAPPSPIKLVAFQDVPPAPGLMEPLISPGFSSGTVNTPLPTLDRAVGNSQAYRMVYDAIPFSRAEYDANPSYRHDSTMEFLFGQLRPMVIQRNNTTVDVFDHNRGYDGSWQGQWMNPWLYPFFHPGYRVHRSY